MTLLEARNYINNNNIKVVVCSSCVELKQDDYDLQGLVFFKEDDKFKEELIKLVKSFKKKIDCVILLEDMGVDYEKETNN